jgi:hypothetical protein
MRNSIQHTFLLNFYLTLKNRSNIFWSKFYDDRNMLKWKMHNEILLKVCCFNKRNMKSKKIYMTIYINNEEQ